MSDLGLPTRKKTKTGYSTNAEVLESLRGKHPIIDDDSGVPQAGQAQVHLCGRAAQGGRPGRAHPHPPSTRPRPAPGGISSTEPNLQNIPVRTELGSRLRALLYGPERLRAGGRRLLADRAAGAGPHRRRPAHDRGLSIRTRTSTPRPPLRSSRCRWISSPRRCAAGPRRSTSASSTASGRSPSRRTSASRWRRPTSYIKGYLETYSGVRHYMEDTVEFAKENGYVADPVRPPPVRCRSSRPPTRTSGAFGKRVAMNTPIQGTAADIIKIAMIRVYRRLLRGEPVGAADFAGARRADCGGAGARGGAGGAAAEGGDGEGRLAQGAAEGGRRCRQNLDRRQIGGMMPRPIRERGFY